MSFIQEIPDFTYAGPQSYRCKLTRNSDVATRSTKIQTPELAYGVLVIAATISQTLAGITFPIGVYIGMIGSWVVMGEFAIWLTIAFFRNLSEIGMERPATMRAAQA